MTGPDCRKGGPSCRSTSKELFPYFLPTASHSPCLSLNHGGTVQRLGLGLERPSWANLGTGSVGGPGGLILGETSSLQLPLRKCGLWDSLSPWQIPCWASVFLGSPAMGRSLTLGRCLLLLLLFLLSLPVPEVGERGWGEGGCIQSAKAGPRPWPGPHRMGRVVGVWHGGRQWGEAEMRWEVTETQSSNLQACQP